MTYEVGPGEDQTVQLRDHPIFIIRNLGSWWPPAWVRPGETGKTQHGEVGVLVEVRYHEKLPKRLFMRVEYEEELYMGALVVKDTALCLQLQKLLQKHIGHTIKEIGDLEIDSLL